MENNNVPSMTAPPPNGRDLDVMEKANLTPMKRSLRIAIISENFLPKCVLAASSRPRSAHVRNPDAHPGHSLLQN